MEGRTKEAVVLSNICDVNERVSLLLSEEGDKEGIMDLSTLW